MNVVILQPSYIPWRGYFHQIHKADLFIFYDDVQYDKHGWRNRNQIKTAQGKQWLTIPVHSIGVTRGRPIRGIEIDWSKPWATNHWKALTFAYAKAPYFRQYAAFLEPFYHRHDQFLADFTIDLTVALTREIGMMHTRFMRASEVPGVPGEKTDRLIQILRQVGAEHYISGPSARDYIEEEKFSEAGITLEYISYDYREYPQFYPPYDPYVTILDLLFMVGENALSYIIKPEEK
ncbi:MAG: WbqC family protein [Chloroflexota bacterium]